MALELCSRMKFHFFTNILAKSLACHNCLDSILDVLVGCHSSIVVRIQCCNVVRSSEVLAPHSIVSDCSIYEFAIPFMKPSNKPKHSHQNQVEASRISVPTLFLDFFLSLSLPLSLLVLLPRSRDNFSCLWSCLRLVLVG